MSFHSLVLPKIKKRELNCNIQSSQVTKFTISASISYFQNPTGVIDISAWNSKIKLCLCMPVWQPLKI